MAQMLETFFSWLSQKGMFLGFAAGSLKVIHAIRAGTFHWVSAITDLSSAIIIGGLAGAAMETTGMAEWQQTLFTVLISLNAFFLVGFFTNKRVINLWLSKYVHIDKDNRRRLEDVVNDPGQSPKDYYEDISNIDIPKDER